LKEDNVKKTEEAQNSSKLKAEACAAVIKLDEMRVVMNRLLGPSGPLTQHERHKFLAAKDSDFAGTPQPEQHNQR
jgi:hypothetical protein